jgi:hypothetical protein
MSKTTDWLPGTREGQLAMARDWQSAAASQKAAWGVPDVILANLHVFANDAETALAVAQNEATRTPVATARCKEAFDALTGFIRDMKRRYFLAPPLLDSDYISLGLKPHDSAPTGSGVPTAQVTLETYLVGRHELGVKMIYVIGAATDPANKGYRIWYRVAGQGETPPEKPDELHTSFFTKRKKDVIEFDFRDSGKTAYFAVQIENG